MPSVDEIVLPETKLETEWIGDRPGYGSQTEIMAKIVQEKLEPKQSRGMRR
jgi:hypothetical protein